MPRPKKADVAEPKKRSRTGCWPCKARKVKCGEEKPQCQNCVKQAEQCDYSIRLNWGGRTKRSNDGSVSFAITPVSATPTPGPSFSSFAVSTPTLKAKTAVAAPTATMMANMASAPGLAHVESAPTMIDPRLTGYDSHLTSSNASTAPCQDTSLSPSIQLPPLNQYPSYGDPAPMSSGGESSYIQLPPYVSGLPLADSTQRQPPNPMQLPPLPDFAWSSQHGTKRVRLSPTQSTQFTLPKPPFTRPALPDSTLNHYDQYSPGSNMLTPYSMSSLINTPLTPGSSIASEDSHGRAAAVHRLNVQRSPNARRMSVNSLLSGPADGDNASPAYSGRGSRYPKTAADGTTIYGYDYGFPDLDLPRNDDANAITPQSPAAVRYERASITELFATHPRTDDESGASTPVAKVRRDIVFERGGYYAQPVPVSISTEYGLLPPFLTENSMNLLYFHHFLNHTARVLVPHDCRSNPLRRLLPQSKRSISSRC